MIALLAIVGVAVCLLGYYIRTYGGVSDAVGEGGGAVARESTVDDGASLGRTSLNESFLPPGVVPGSGLVAGRGVARRGGPDVGSWWNQGRRWLSVLRS